MLSAVKISELELHPQVNDPNFIDQDHILPVLGKDGSGAWTTYKAPISSVVPNIVIEATASSVSPTTPPTVTVAPGTIRNQFDLDFHIPQGRVPNLSGGVLTPVSTSTGTVVMRAPATFNPNVDYYVDMYMPKGPKGDQGDQGIGINFKGFKNTKADLNALLTVVPSPCLGDAWFVKADESITSSASSDVFYIFSLSGNPAISTFVAGGSGLKGPKGEQGTPGLPVTFTLASAISVPTSNPLEVFINPAPGLDPNLFKQLVLKIPQGLSGISPVLSADPVALSGVFGTAPSVQTLGTNNAPIFKFTIPQGPTGIQGLSGITPILSAGTVTALSAGDTPYVRANVLSTPGKQILDFGIPMGRTPIVLVGSVSALSAGATPIVTTTTSTDNLSSTLSFGIPVGRAATVALATPPAVSATFTAQPSVVNTGSLSAAVFQFVIPQGAPGDWTAAQGLDVQTASFTVASTQVGKIVRVNSSSAVTISLPSAPAGILPGQKIDFINMNTGTVTFAAGTGTPQVNGTPSLALRAQWSSATAILLANGAGTATHWVVVGDLA